MRTIEPLTDFGRKHCCYTKATLTTKSRCTIQLPAGWEVRIFTRTRAGDNFIELEKRVKAGSPSNPIITFHYRKRVEAAMRFAWIIQCFVDLGQIERAFLQVATGPVPARIPYDMDMVIN